MLVVLDNEAPTPAFTVSARPEVHAVTKLSAAGSSDPDGDDASLTFAWDFDPSDGFQVEATGRDIQHTFASPGSHNVTLRVTDQFGGTADLTQEVLVDDGIFVTVDLLTEDPTVSSVIEGTARVTLWDGTGIHNMSVTIGVFYKPAPTSTSRLLHTFEVVTGEDGTIAFELPADTDLGNLVGDHFVTAFASTNQSLNGNMESSSDREDYFVGP